jgi:phosphatidate cytidylyltransferase
MSSVAGPRKVIARERLIFVPVWTALIIAVLVALPMAATLALCLAAAVAALRDYAVLVGLRRVPVVLGGLAVTGSFLGGPHYLPQLALFLTIVVALVIAVARRAGDPGALFREVLLTAFGWWYVSWCLGHVAWLARLEHGRELVLYLYVLTATRNIGAAVLRPLAGGPPVSFVSPDKTIGAGLAGWLVAAATTSLLKPLIAPNIDVAHHIAFIAVGPILGQFGDLSESLIKRAAAARDSGTYLPGQGGVLDAVDSFFFTAPFMYYALTAW